MNRTANKSVDKCIGDDCICHKIFKPRKIFTEMKIESISINSGPSIFPGAGSIQMVTHRQQRTPAEMIEIMRREGGW